MGWLTVTVGTLVLGVVALAVGAWAVSGSDAPVTPKGLQGGIIVGPILIGIGIAELVRRWRRATVSARRGRHARMP